MKNDDVILYTVLIVIVLFVIVVAALGSKKRKKQKEQEEQEKNSLLSNEFEKFKNYLNDFEGTKNKLLQMSLKGVKENMAQFDIKKKLIEEFDSIDEEIASRDKIREQLLGLKNNEIKAALSNVKRQLELIQKYGQEDGLRIFKKEVWIGMSEDQLLDSRGMPTKVEIEELKTKAKRVLIYGNKNSGDIFTFVNGELERFKDR